MLPQLALLPPFGHKEAIGTLGYPIPSKLEDIRVSTDRNTGLYNIDYPLKFTPNIYENYIFCPLEFFHPISPTKSREMS